MNVDDFKLGIKRTIQSITYRGEQEYFAVTFNAYSHLCTREGANIRALFFRGTIFQSYDNDFPNCLSLICVYILYKTNIVAFEKSIWNCCKVIWKNENRFFTLYIYKSSRFELLFYQYSIPFRHSHSHQTSLHTHYIHCINAIDFPSRLIIIIIAN